MLFSESLWGLGCGPYGQRSASACSETEKGLKTAGRIVAVSKNLFARRDTTTCLPIAAQRVRDRGFMGIP